MSVLTARSESPSIHEPDISSFEAFKDTFVYQGDRLYEILFYRNQDVIKTKKAKVAAANLRKIFETTFEYSSKKGFDQLTLRNIAEATGISMGGIYSTISKKEDIVLMILDIVELISSANNQYVQNVDDELLAIERLVKHHLYAATVLQPWFFFLFFETRCLSPENQARSKSLEMKTIATVEQIIQRGIENGRFDVESAYFSAQTLLVSLQDWYLKPWRNKAKRIDLDMYTQYLFRIAKKFLA